MAKKFNIHDWQAKQRLAEMQSMDFGPNCPQYDSPEGEGKMAKGNAIELSHDAADVANMIGPNTNLPEWVESKITLAADYLNKVKDYLTHYDASREKLAEQDDYQKRQDRLTPGKNPEEFYGSDSLFSQESMSNADIRALQTVVGEYSLNKILNTIAVIADKTGKHDEADMVKKLADKIQDFNQEDELDEANMTGTGASFSAGSGEGYMSPNAFGDDKEKKMKTYKSLGYKKV